jgi:hypothetical protein
MACSMTRCWEGPLGAVETVAGAVLVHGGAADHGQYVVPVAAGVGEALHQQYADALGPSGAVGGVGEGAAQTVGGQAALPAELQVGGGGGHDGDAAGEGE